MRLILSRATASVALVALVAGVLPAAANPAIVIDAASGETLMQQDATRPWYPASLSKLMTVFVALKAVREGRITMDTPLKVSVRATTQAPSKMGFRAGTLVTLDNALKMLMVKSANDLAITIAEGVSGSVEAFANEMNASASALGMRESHFVNPNGLPDPRQISSARDMAILARSLYVYFPEQAGLFDIGALRLAGHIIPTHNGMLGRYPGADGMKTGFTCAAGFNLVASASQNGRHLIAVVLGAPSAKSRTMLAASLLDKGFMSGGTQGQGPVTSLASTGGEPPDMHDFACRNRGKASAEFEAQVEDMSAPIPRGFLQAAQGPEGASPYAAGPAAAAQASATLRPSQIATLPRPAFEPIPVFVGPVAGWTGPIAHAEGDTATPVTQAYTADGEADADSPVKPAPDAQSMRARRTAKAKAHKPAHVAKAKPAAVKPVKAAKAKPAAAKPAKVAAHKATMAKAAKPAKPADE